MLCTVTCYFYLVDFLRCMLQFRSGQHHSSSKRKCIYKCDTSRFAKTLLKLDPSVFCRKAESLLGSYSDMAR